jgi:hypothetical protein
VNIETTPKRSRPCAGNQRIDPLLVFVNAKIVEQPDFIETVFIDVEVNA